MAMPKKKDTAIWLW